MLSKIHTHTFKYLLIASFVAPFMLLTSTALAASIPAGCPGSTVQGPPSVDCSKIPLGCPGSTLQGPIATPPTNCPYAAPVAPTTPTTSNQVNLGQTSGRYYCGDGDQAVNISFDIGCKGKGGGIKSPITDAAFAIIRFLSIGVGFIIVGSLTFAGIQYTASRGDPKATAEAIKRIRSNVIAFLIYVFSFAILNFLIPKGFFG